MGSEGSGRLQTNSRKSSHIIDIIIDILVDFAIINIIIGIIIDIDLIIGINFTCN